MIFPSGTSDKDAAQEFAEKHQCLSLPPHVRVQNDADGTVGRVFLNGIEIPGAIPEYDFLTGMCTLKFRAKFEVQ